MIIEKIHEFVNFMNSIIWGGKWGDTVFPPLLVYILIGVGIYFTVRTAFVPIRLFGRSIKEMLGGRQDNGDPHGITPFQAFVTGLASRVGTGNVAGVAIAISSGGPGAVFWMWLAAFLGMSSAFAESSLAQLFKIRDVHNGQFRGGPAYYIKQGLRQGWAGILFAITLILAYGFIFNSVQANTIVEATNQAWGWKAQYVGIALVIITAPIIWGSIRRVAHAAEAIVPIMAVLYLLMALYVVFTNIGEIPHIFKSIFDNAFNFHSVAGGAAGYGISQAMMLGVKRGLFSNEAGMGSAPNAAAAADVKHPVSQGLIQMLGVFVDTFVVCSCTAFIILLTPTHPAGLEAAKLTQYAVASHVGNWGYHFMAVVLFLFAFSSIIGNYAYAESNIQYIKDNPQVMLVFRLFVLGMVYFGSVTKVELVWDMADTSMGLMALVNLVAIVLLSPFVILLLRDYQAKLRMGKTEPEFKISEHPGLREKVGGDLW